MRTIATSRAVRWLVFVFACAYGGGSLDAAYNDVVIMKNGDRFTGEIKSLTRGELIFKAHYMTDSVHLDWAEVASLHSTRRFRVEMGLDVRRLGTISVDAEQQENFAVDLGTNDAVRVSSREVSTIEPVEKKGLKRFDGDASLGFTYTSGNAQTQLSFSGSATYQASRYAYDVSGSSILSSQNDGSNTSRQNLTNSVTRFVSRRYRVFGLVDLLQSDQQQLALRTTAGAGFGRDFLRSASTIFTGLGGLVFTRERYQDTDAGPGTIRDNAEVLAGVAYNYYRFKSFSVDTHGYSYFSVNSPGRVRLDLSATWTLDVWRDLHWSLTVYENADSRPPSDTPKNDFGVTSTFGWKF